MKKLSLIISGLLISGIIFYACQDRSITDPANENLLKPPSQLAPPQISCGDNTGTSIEIQVCGGANGAPAGFTIQWETVEDYNTYGWSADNAPSYCQGSFSGVPGCSQYNLQSSSSCVTVNIGNLSDEECGVSGGCGELECGTDYVFRAFAHNVPGGLNKSNFTSNLYCNTADCGSGECSGETAWGGNNGVNVSSNGAWFYYYDTATGGVQTLWAGQYSNAGTVEYTGGQIIIILAADWYLIAGNETVKIQGYNEAPTTHPIPGQFQTYKGTELTITVPAYNYYAIHLDVEHCP